MKKNSFVDFYSKHNISPVSQDIEDIALHFERRNSLFSSLGLPALLIKGSEVLEFGPGSGHNSVYTASLEPFRYYLVDGNPKGVEETKKLLSKNSISDLKIIFSLFLDYKAKEKFDIVWAEGCIPHQKVPIQILKHLAHFTKYGGGIFVLSTSNGISYLSETVRRLGSFMHFDKSLSLNEQVSFLRPMLRQHLEHLKGMSRPVDDWIIDNILQPLQESMLLSIPEVIETLSDGFEVYGSSPKFITDWRWYKDITGEKRGFNKNAISGYYRSNINLLDTRLNLDPIAIDFGKELEKMCSESWEIMSVIQKGKNSEWQSFFDLLTNISKFVKEYAPETAEAIIESSSWLQEGAPLNSNLELLPKWWGKGQQYLSFIRKSNKK